MIQARAGQNARPSVFLVGNIGGSPVVCEDVSRGALVLGVVLLACKREPPCVSADPGPPLTQQAFVTPFAPRGPAAVPEIRPALAPSHEPSLSLLREKDLVGGELISMAGYEPPFHDAWRTVFSTEGPSTTAWLAADDHPTVRALGLWNLAVAEKDEALVSHFCDRERVKLCPYGCVCSETSVGELAQHWAVDPAWLSMLGASSPREPFTSDDRVRLAIALHGVDACRAGKEWRAFIEKPEWGWLRSHAPTLPGWMVVKALARLQPDSRELISILDDPGAPSDARLAAASALTRSHLPSALSALGRNEGFLDARQPGLARKLRLSHERALELWDATGLGWRPAENDEKALDVLAIRHPLTIEAASTVLWRFDPSKLKEAAAHTLFALSEDLLNHLECWDVDRDTAYELERLLPAPRLDRIDKKWLELLDPAERVRFVANVRRAVKVLDRTCH